MSEQYGFDMGTASFDFGRGQAGFDFSTPESAHSREERERRRRNEEESPQRRKREREQRQREESANRERQRQQDRSRIHFRVYRVGEAFADVEEAQTSSSRCGTQGGADTRSSTQTLADRPMRSGYNRAYRA